MATAGPSNFEDLTTCMICLETFTRPKRLPCEHSYCYACLMLLGKDKSTITCPYCQEEHEIPASGVSGFKNNLLLSNLIGMSLPQSEVCTDCGERRSVPDECEHCGQKICQKCLVGHTKLSLELTNSVNQLTEDFSTSISQDMKLKFETYESNLEVERKKMTGIFREEAVNKLVEVKILLERSKFMNELMRNIGELYKILSNEDEKAKRVSYTSGLSVKIGECSTIDSLKDMKNSMTDLKTLLRLMQTKDEEFRFRYSTSPQEGSGQLEFGQAVVNVRGNHQTQNIVDQIAQLVQDSAEVLGEHVATACEPRVDHVLPLPPARGTRDAKTETEGRFLEPIRGKETAVVDSDIEKKRSESANVASCSNQVSSDISSSASNESVPTSELSKSEKPRQNELPRHVDYADKARRRGVVVIGQGDAVKEENRLSLPRGCAYHEARDEIFVADYDNQRIMAYSADGRTGRVFYMDVRDPRDVAVSTDGKYVYIAAESSLIKVDIDGRHVKTIKRFSLGDFKDCMSVVCHREFTVTVDITHARAIVFNDRDEEVRSIGREHLTEPRSVAVSEDGMLYVTDDESSCVKVFDWGGQYIQTFDTDMNNETEGIAVDGEGNVCVSRYCSDRVDVYSPRRELLTSIGGPGNKPGELNGPDGLCLTKDGRLLVADFGNDRVQIF